MNEIDSAPAGPPIGAESRHPPAEPIAFRYMSDRLPNEALRDELATMSAEQEEAYLRRLGELARLYQGPGGP